MFLFFPGSLFACGLMAFSHRVLPCCSPYTKQPFILGVLVLKIASLTFALKHYDHLRVMAAVRVIRERMEKEPVV